MKGAVLAAMLVAAGELCAQQMYRCTAPDGSLSFQDKPCPAGTRQSVSGSVPSPTTTGPVRLRPRHMQTAAQKAEYEKLFFAYAEVFRVVGRASACKVPRFEERMNELLKAMQQRHGDYDDIAMSALVGIGAGMDNKLIGNEPDQSKPPVPVPCEIIASQLANLRLPDVPASLVMGADEPVDYELQRARQLSTGPYRIVRRKPADGGVEQTVVLHNDKVVFTSALQFSKDQRVEAPVPVLLIAVRDPGLRCPERTDQVAWHAIALPRDRKARVMRLDADCREVVAYHRGAGFKRPSACIDLGPQPNRRYFAVDDAGRIAPTSEPAPGSCH